MNIQVNKLDTAVPTCLYVRYPRQQEAQRCYMEVDFHHRMLGIVVNMDPLGTYPLRVIRKSAIWFPIPWLCASAANELLDEMAESASLLIDSTTLQENEHTHAYSHHRTAKGYQLMQQFDELEDPDKYPLHSLITVHQADDFFEYSVKGLPDWVALPSALSQKADFRRIAEAIRKEFPKSDFTGGWLYLEGLEDFLESCLMELQDIKTDGRKEAMECLQKHGDLSALSNITGPDRNCTGNMTPQMFMARMEGVREALATFFC